MCRIARIDRFLADWPGAEWGPAHIALSDANIDDGSLDWCIALAEAALDPAKASALPENHRALLPLYADKPRDELEATLAFLREFRAIPEAEREEPGDTRCPVVGDEDD